MKDKKLLKIKSLSFIYYIFPQRELWLCKNEEPNAPHFHFKCGGVLCAE
jgi:hypothetical protein